MVEDWPGEDERPEKAGPKGSAHSPTLVILALSSDISTVKHLSPSYDSRINPVQHCGRESCPTRYMSKMAIAFRYDYLVRSTDITYESAQRTGESYLRCKSSKPVP